VSYRPFLETKLRASRTFFCGRALTDSQKLIAAICGDH
jgi:hypothetical protein